MMTLHTVQQLLDVFRLFRQNLAAGMSLRSSYTKAVHIVAQQYSVTYQTIGDGCRRRLELDNISKLYELLAAWAKGDARPLARQLKEHSIAAAHADIDAFFAGIPSRISSEQESSLVPVSGEETETVSFRLPTSDARLLRALAELEGSSVGELTARMVAMSVKEQIKIVARGLLQAR